MIPKVILALLFAAALNAAAAPRTWKSADGQRSVKGEFVKRDADAVTIRRSADFKNVAIPLDQLFAEDLAWLNAYHPAPGTKPVAPLPSIVFEPLIAFGDSRVQVQEKLKVNKHVEATIAETLMGRTGLNGAYRANEKIGGLDAGLYFDWDENGTLKELTFQTFPQPASDLEESLLPCWKTFITLLTNQFGEPIKAQDKLDLSAAKENEIATTHMWKLKESGTALLGISLDSGRYLIAARFINAAPKFVPAE